MPECAVLKFLIGVPSSGQGLLRLGLSHFAFGFETSDMPKKQHRHHKARGSRTGRPGRECGSNPAERPSGPLDEPVGSSVQVCQNAVILFTYCEGVHRFILPLLCRENYLPEYALLLT